MGLVALVVAATLAYLQFTGQLTRGLAMRLGAFALGLVAVFEVVKGLWVPALALGLGAVVWYQWQKRPRTPQLGADEARRVLGLSAGADAGVVRAAHRRLVAQVHPDRGGSADLTARVNAARDALLAELKQSRG